MEGHVCGTGHCLNTLSEHHSQLAKLYGRLSMSDKSEIELIAEDHSGRHEEIWRRVAGRSG